MMIKKAQHWDDLDGPFWMVEKPPLIRACHAANTARAVLPEPVGRQHMTSCRQKDLGMISPSAGNICYDMLWLWVKEV